MEKKETLDAICERIKALENEVCALRVQNKHLRVVIAALVALAVLPYLIAAGMQAQTFSVLRVERIEFVKGGKLIAAIEGRETNSEGYELGIYDKDGKRMVVVGYSKSPSKSLGVSVSLLDGDGKETIGLHSIYRVANLINIFGGAGGGIQLFADRDGFNSVSVYGRDGGKIELLTVPYMGNSVSVSWGAGRGIELFAKPNGINSVDVYNNKGENVISLGTMSELNPSADSHSGYLDIKDGGGKEKISLFVTRERDSIISAFSRDGKGGVFIGSQDTGGRIEITRSPRAGNTEMSAVAISVLPNGSGGIVTTNFLGLPIWSTPLR